MGATDGSATRGVTGPAADGTDSGGPVSPVAQDVAYLATVTNPELREAMVCSLRQYRQPDRLAVGDPVPPLELGTLDGTRMLRLDAHAGDRPLVLLFGSYT